MLRLFISILPSQLFSGYSPSPPRVLNPSALVTLILSCTALFYSIIPPLTVLDCLSPWKRVHSRRPPPPVSEITVLPPLTGSPGPCRPLQPRAVIPFLLPLSPSGHLPFVALDMVVSLSISLVSPF